MTIAIDYDETYTTDPDLWDAVISLMEARGHTVVCVTCRSDHPDEHVAFTDITIPVIYTHRRPKLEAVKTLLLSPIDIWIDDDPFSIVDTF